MECGLSTALLTLFHETKWNLLNAGMPLITITWIPARFRCLSSTKFFSCLIILRCAEISQLYLNNKTSRKYKNMLRYTKKVEHIQTRISSSIDKTGFTFSCTDGCMEWRSVYEIKVVKKYLTRTYCQNGAIIFRLLCVVPKIKQLKC